MKRVIIVGGGVSGLVCAHTFQKHPELDIKLLEPKAVGGEFLAGGLKYIHRTTAMEKMLDELDVPFSDYTVHGGIMLQEQVHHYLKCFEGMEADRALRIQMDHYRKTRRAEPGTDAKKAMNDPAATKPRQALRCDFAEMIQCLARGINIVRSGLQRIEKDHIIASGEQMPFDFLVLTIPLWVVREVAKFYAPHGVAMKLNVAEVVPKNDRYARWDYVYTPYTPADCIHRFSPSGDGYAVEVNGDLDKLKLESDLNFIFPGGWSIEGLREGLKGHLLPLDQEPEWPSNVAPLGRFAKWDSRATTDVTLDDATELAKRWFG